jgi:hypothetical protein
MSEESDRNEGKVDRFICIKRKCPENQKNRCTFPFNQRAKCHSNGRFVRTDVSEEFEDSILRSIQDKLIDALGDLLD